MSHLHDMLLTITVGVFLLLSPFIDADGFVDTPSMSTGDSTQQELTTKADAMNKFKEWHAEAVKELGIQASYTSLATCTLDGYPSNRIVLLQVADDRGFVFCSNQGSQKGTELKTNPRAALCFHWNYFQRQIRIEGEVEKLPAEDSDRLFAPRPYASKVGAWACQQSINLDKAELEAKYEKFKARFPEDPVPRPEWWTGYRLIPKRIEFWQEGFTAEGARKLIGVDMRLVQRIVFAEEEKAGTCDAAKNGTWKKFELVP